MSQTVEVAAGAELLQTEKSDVSETFSQSQIASLPLINRNLTNLYADVPGVSTPFRWELARIRG